MINCSKCVCAQAVGWVSPDVESEAALQLLMRHCGHLASHTAWLDRLKTLLRELVSDERRQLGVEWALESHSQESVVAAAAAAAARRVDLRRYKTELCRSYAETGQCRYGQKCQFAHGPDELRPLVRHPRYRTELCHSFHVNGFCPYGSRCNFIHSDFTVTQAPASSKLTQIPNPQPAAAPLLPRSPGNCPVVQQCLKQSDDVKQRAICGRQTAGEMCPAAVFQAFSSSQAAAHMKLMQNR